MMQDIRDALDPIPLAAPSNLHWPFLVACALAAAVVAAVALAAVWMVRRRVQRRPAPSPEQRALHRLSQANLSQAGKADVRAYYFELTAILAEYLDAHFDLQFAQCTSAEMLRRLRDLGAMTGECCGALREFLEESDRVKFASSIEGADAATAGRRCQRILYLFGGQIASTRQLAQPVGRPILAAAGFQPALAGRKDSLMARKSRHALP
jgi:hypothetical protein